jgi:hypothetical protein
MELSSLTRTQLDTLRINISLRKGEINLEKALERGNNGRISRGTHYRILAQARKNVKKSLFTLAVAVQLGLVRPEDVQKLLSSVSMVPTDLDSEQVREVIGVLRLLVDRIVML